MPTSMKALLAAGPNAMARVRELSGAAQAHDGGHFDPAWSDEADARLPGAGRRCRQVPVRRQELPRAPGGAEADELIKEMPEEPTAFVKLNSSLVGHRANVVRPEGIVRLDYEPELVFVIGRRALRRQEGRGVRLRRRRDDAERPHRPRRAEARGGIGLALLDRQEHAGLRPARPGDRHDGRDRRSLRPLDDVRGQRRAAHARQHARPDLEAARHRRALLALHPARAGRHVLDRRAGRRRRRQAERGGAVPQARRRRRVRDRRHRDAANDDRRAEAKAAGRARC